VKPGDVVDGYEIVSRLASGATASLHLAQPADDPRPEAAVAMKVLHPHRAHDPGFVEMLADEAAIIRRIDHPNVTRVLGHGVHEGRPYLLFEYVHGVTLGELLTALGRNGRRLIPELATWIGLEIAEGLQAAHECRGKDGTLLGVVHRDLKPGNVMIDVAGHVKIIDFGIARAEGRIHETAAGVVKGTPRYAAPEQTAGLAVDRRADIFALGVVLWEMLAMRRLVWEGDRAPSIRRFVEEISPELDTTVRSALERDRDARPESAAAYRDAITRALDARTLLQTPHRDLAVVLHAVLEERLAERASAVPEAISMRFEPAERSVETVDAKEGVPMTLRTVSVVFSDDAGDPAVDREAETTASPIRPDTGDDTRDESRKSLITIRPPAVDTSDEIARRGYAILVVVALALGSLGFLAARLIGQ
jgi:serine/threonine-protein kinase